MLSVQRSGSSHRIPSLSKQSSPHIHSQVRSLEAQKQAGDHKKARPDGNYFEEVISERSMSKERT